MPAIKEPHFFAQDLGSYPRIKTLEDYLSLFAECTEDHLRAGEASVYYLRSTTAIANIHRFNPDARIIAMFRNPVDMVYALHSQLLYVGEEVISDFEKAWRLQERRSQGFDLPPGSRGSFLLHYEQFGHFGTQAQRLLSTFPATQVKLILYDDFAADAQKVYDEVIAFLGIPHDGRSSFPRINESKGARVGWLRRFSRKPPPVLRTAVRRLKEAVGEGGISAVKNKLVELNTIRQPRAPLDPELRAELVQTFRDEVLLLSRVLNRDLSHWQ